MILSRKSIYIFEILFILGKKKISISVSDVFFEVKKKKVKLFECMGLYYETKL